MKKKSSCCEKFLRKAKVCKGCPVLLALPKKERKRWKKKHLKKAA